MTTVLLTGFEPFAGDETNPSGDAVRAMAERWNGEERLVTEILPVAFAAAARRVGELIDAERPDVFVLVGLAGGRAQVTPERIAINLADARIPDNHGAQPVDEPSHAEGPAAYFSILPVKAIAAALTAAGIPAGISHSAGTFVCNHTMYTALHRAAQTRPDTRAGFVHVPYASENAPAGMPSLPLDEIVRALEIAVRTSIDVRVDVTAPGGTLH